MRENEIGTRGLATGVACPLSFEPIGADEPSSHESCSSWKRNRVLELLHWHTTPFNKDWVCPWWVQSGCNVWLLFLNCLWSSIHAFHRNGRAKTESDWPSQVILCWFWCIIAQICVVLLLETLRLEFIQQYIRNAALFTLGTDLRAPRRTLKSRSCQKECLKRKLGSKKHPKTSAFPQQKRRRHFLRRWFHKAVNPMNHTTTPGWGPTINIPAHMPRTWHQNSSIRVHFFLLCFSQDLFVTSVPQDTCLSGTQTSLHICSVVKTVFVKQIASRANKRLSFWNRLRRPEIVTPLR